MKFPWNPFVLTVESQLIIPKLHKINLNTFGYNRNKSSSRSLWWHIGHQTHTTFCPVKFSQCWSPVGWDSWWPSGVFFNGYFWRKRPLRGNSSVVRRDESIFGFGCPISVMFDLQRETWNKHHELVIPIDSWVHSPRMGWKNWNHHWYPWIHSRWLKQC